MGDSEQPKPAAPSFEVPDLELEPVPRSFRAPPEPIAAAVPKPVSRIAAAAPSLFDEDDFLDSSMGLELALGTSQDDQVAPRSARCTTTIATVDANTWPSGRATDRARLALDPAELALLARYGEPPTNPLLTPAYAYRVFLRQRELKAELEPLDHELAHAENERENALVELASAVRPEAEREEQLKRWLAPLLELEQVAAARGQALSAASADLAQQSVAIDQELDSLATQLELAVAGERDAQREYEANEDAFRRADAKLKRVHIEVRAVTQVAEHKLGPNGGEVPEPEASRLAELRARAASIEPEVQSARRKLESAKNALDQASTRVAALHHNGRLAERKKQGLIAHYRHELDLRGRSLDESAQQGRAALADLGRAILALRGAVDVPEALLARVRDACEQADALSLRAERYLRALDSYDRARAAQGVKLACTALAVFIALVALKVLL